MLASLRFYRAHPVQAELPHSGRQFAALLMDMSLAMLLAGGSVGTAPVTGTPLQPVAIGVVAPSQG